MPSACSRTAAAFLSSPIAGRPLLSRYLASSPANPGGSVSSKYPEASIWGLPWIMKGLHGWKSRGFDKVYLPFVKTNERPSTAVGCGELWRGYLKPLCGDRWMKDVRTFDVQQWLSPIAEKGLSRNSLKHLKSLLSAIFKHAKQQGYFDGQNPVVDTAVNPHATEPEEGYADSFEEITGILAQIPEPAATAFSIAAFTGLRIGEIQGLDWEDFRDGEIHVSRSVWRGHET